MTKVETYQCGMMTHFSFHRIVKYCHKKRGRVHDLYILFHYDFSRSKSGRTQRVLMSVHFGVTSGVINQRYNLSSHLRPLLSPPPPVWSWNKFILFVTRTKC